MTEPKLEDTRPNAPVKSRSLLWSPLIPGLVPFSRRRNSAFAWIVRRLILLTVLLFVSYFVVGSLLVLVIEFVTWLGASGVIR